MSLIPGKHSQFSDIHSQHKETSSAQEVSETSVQRVLKTSAQRVLPTLFPKGMNTRSSWLNCALRDDEAVYWVSIGHYEAVAVGN